MVRLKDIAEYTGLTVSTVSKALNYSKEISRETTKIVWEAAKDMGYISKKGAKRGEKTIGVILPEVSSQYYAKLMHTLDEEIEKNDYVMITMLTVGNENHVEKQIQRMIRYEPEGIIVCSCTPMKESTCQMLLDCGIPVLLLDEVDFSLPLDSICIEPGQSVRQAVEHLVQLGHRNIGYIGECRSDSRYRAFCSAMSQNGLEVEPCFVKRGEVRFEEGGYQLALELLKEPNLPSAVIASYDQIAFGAMRAFRENNLRVPQDISIVGFDNIVMDDYSHVPLTSVRNPVEQMGITAVKILLDAMRHPNSHVVQNVSLQSRLVVRESTAAVKSRM